jgi:hypothetical protein
MYVSSTTDGRTQLWRWAHCSSVGAKWRAGVSRRRSSCSRRRCSTGSACGDLAGFLLAKGDPEKLARIRASDEFIALNTRGQLLVQNFGVVGAFVGEDLQRLFADFGKQAAALG